MDFAIVVIDQFEDNVYHSKLLLSQHDKAYEVECPPAVALALGVRADGGFG